MKKAFEEAAELFRENEKLSDRSGARKREHTNYYRALALLAEGLHKLDKKFDQIEPSPQLPHSIMFRRRTPAAIIMTQPNP